MASAKLAWSERVLFLHHLRMFSALLVCLSHSKEFFVNNISSEAMQLEKVFRLFMSLGNPAVLVFFFLSGYLVGGNEIRRLILRKIQSRKYLLDRLTRLWLVLIPALLFTMIINFLACSRNNQALYCKASIELASHPSYPPLMLQGIRNFAENIFFLQPFRGEMFGGNGPLWSLSYEFWYYMVFMCAMLAISSVINRRFEKGLILFLPISIFGIVIVDSKWFTLGIVWFAGAALSYFLSNLSVEKFFLRLSSLRRYKLIILNGFFVIPPILCVRLFPQSLLSYIFLVLCLSIAVAATQTTAIREEKTLVQKITVRGSEFSFSLYLIHFPLMGLLATHLTPLFRLDFGLRSVSICVFSVILVAGIADIFARLTEDRLNSLRSRLKIFYGLN